tara:strand:- start:497 stop:1435 length:939 start_codon:yes stop_codon:yes gene_type:complete
LISIAEAPGKIILTGEHFVVHGSQALAAAINKKLRVTSTLSSTDDIIYKNQRIPSSKYNIKNDPVYIVRNKTLEYLDKKNTLSITIDSGIPRGSGLGSSSALCVATAASIASLFNIKLDRKTLFELAMHGEKKIHGNPSGIDVAVSIMGGLISFRKGGEPKRITLKHNPELIVSISGKRRKTSNMINKFSNAKRDKPSTFLSLVESSNTITKKTISALSKKDYVAVGSYFNFFNSTLNSLGLSSSPTDNVIEKCLELGSYGAKITGGGGGGSIIAISPSRHISVIVNELNKMDYETFSVKLPQQGVKVWSIN